MAEQDQPFKARLVPDAEDGYWIVEGPNEYYSEDRVLSSAARAHADSMSKGWELGRRSMQEELFSYYQDLIPPGGSISRSELLAHLENLHLSKPCTHPALAAGRCALCGKPPP